MTNISETSMRYNSNSRLAMLPFWLHSNVFIIFANLKPNSLQLTIFLIVI